MGGESNDPNQTQCTTNACKETKCKWSPIEDVVLIKAWLNTSNDPFIGNEQKASASAFQKRIGAYFSSSPAVSSLPKRESSNCKKIWQKINDSINKFVGCYDQAVSQRTSGQSEDDVVQVSYQFYFDDCKKRFTLEHAWRKLRHSQKWYSYISKCSKSSGSSKRAKLDEGGTFSSSSNTKSNVEEHAMVARPIGVKSSKGEGENVVTKTTNEENVVTTKTTNEERESNSRSRLENLWALNEKDIAERNKLSRIELLRSLLGKTEKLSEKEETLKNKLIDEML